MSFFGLFGHAAGQASSGSSKSRGGCRGTGPARARRSRKTKHHVWLAQTLSPFTHKNAHTRAHTHTHTQTLPPTHMHACTHTHTLIQACMHARTHAHTRQTHATHTHMLAHTHTHTHTHAHACTQVCKHIFLCNLQITFQ